MKVKVELPSWIFISASPSWPTQKSCLKMFAGNKINENIVSGKYIIEYPVFGNATVEWGTDPQGRLFVEGVSTSGNLARITWPAEERCNDHGYFEFFGARHALRDEGNEAGALFDFIFREKFEHLGRLKVIEYESWRTDAPWWEYGLEPTAPKGAKPYKCISSETEKITTFGKILKEAIAGDKK